MSPKTKKDLQVAKRIANLGSETAFVIAAQAAAHAAKGNKVYPFHLGDIDLTTPENIIEAAHRALQAGHTGYTPNTGIPALREALAKEMNRTRGTAYNAENVAVQPGGKPVIGKFLLALMNPGDEVLYPNPGFPIYESQITFHNGVPVPYGVQLSGDRFTFDIDQMEQAITPRTRLLIVNDLHNPTGAECSPKERQRIAELAVRHNLLVLLDEAYFDIRYDGTSASLVSEPGIAERSVILYTFSKKFAMTGWRLGAAIGPKHIIDIFATLNVNDESCTSHCTQYAGLEALTGDQQGAQDILARLKRRRNLATKLLNSMEGVHCVRPNTTFYLYPEVTEAMANKGCQDYGKFLTSILEHTGVSMCARSHFGTSAATEQRKYLRLAYSGIDVEMIEEGLEKLKKFLAS